MPALYRVADARAIAARKWYIGLVAVQALLLLIGAMGATFAGPLNMRGMALVGSAAFLIVAVLRLYIRFSTLDTAWYQDRVVAEALKSLVWRYAVAVDPFGRDIEDAAALFAARTAEVVADVGTERQHVAHDDIGEITSAMDELRMQRLADRIVTYRMSRLEDQADWYRRKAIHNRRQVRLWDSVFIAASVAAIVFGVLQVTSRLETNLLGLSGFVVSLVAMWSGIHHFAALERRYSRSADELAQRADQLAAVEDEQTWAAFVDATESLIAHEHVAWRIARADG